ncbi:hypothetical protein, partial [Enterobacter cloacae complex sp. BZL2004]
NDVTLKMPAFEWVHVQLHQQKGMISLSPPTICNSAKKIILSALACTALLTGCVSQDKGNAMQSQLNNQQRQINELSVRLQSAESRLSKQEEKLRNELLQSSGYCYLNGARYSTGTVLYGRICQNQSGSASWQVYSRR